MTLQTRDPYHMRSCTKSCINFPKCSSWKLSIYQLHDVISIITTEPKKRPRNPKIQVFKDRSLLNFNLICFLKDFYESRKGYLIISSTHNIIIIVCKIGYSTIRKFLTIYCMTNCVFLVFQKCNHCIEGYIPL